MGSATGLGGVPRAAGGLSEAPRGPLLVFMQPRFRGSKDTEELVD